MSMPDPGLSYIKRIVKKRDGIYIGKTDIRKPGSIAACDRVKIPKGYIRVVAMYNSYPKNVTYQWMEKYGEVGKRLGIEPPDYCGEDAPPAKRTA